MSIRIEDLAKTDFRSVMVAGGKLIAPTSPGQNAASLAGASRVGQRVAQQTQDVGLHELL